MSILFVLVSGIVFTCMLVFWKNRLQVKRNSGEKSSNSTSLALVKTTPTWPPKSNTGSLSGNNFSPDIFNHFLHSIAMQKRILVNLTILEYNLAEMEYLIKRKGLVKRKSTKKCYSM